MLERVRRVTAVAAGGALVVGGIVALETVHIDITAVGALRLDAGAEGLQGGQDALEGDRFLTPLELDFLLFLPRPLFVSLLLGWS